MDVYSFGVTLYECFIWGDEYKKAQFKFPKLISARVKVGKSVEKSK